MIIVSKPQIVVMAAIKRNARGHDDDCVKAKIAIMRAIKRNVWGHSVAAKRFGSKALKEKLLC